MQPIDFLIHIDIPSRLIFEIRVVFLFSQSFSLIGTRDIRVSNFRDNAETISPVRSISAQACGKSSRITAMYIS